MNYSILSTLHRSPQNSVNIVSPIFSQEMMAPSLLLWELRTTYLHTKAPTETESTGQKQLLILIPLYSKEGQCDVVWALYITINDINE